MKYWDKLPSERQIADAASELDVDWLKDELPAPNDLHRWKLNWILTTFCIPACLLTGWTTFSSKFLLDF